MDDFNAVFSFTGPAAGSTVPQGRVTFLRGSAKLDDVTGLDGVFGLAASVTQGFQSGSIRPASLPNCSMPP